MRSPVVGASTGSAPLARDYPIRWGFGGAHLVPWPTKRAGAGKVRLMFGLFKKLSQRAAFRSVCGDQALAHPDIGFYRSSSSGEEMEPSNAKTSGEVEEARPGKRFRKILRRPAIDVAVVLGIVDPEILIGP